MMTSKLDQQRVRQMLVEAIKTLCKNGLSYKNEFSIDGLLGITLDNSDIFLVSIRETINFTDGDQLSKDHEYTQATLLPFPNVVCEEDMEIATISKIDAECDVLTGGDLVNDENRLDIDKAPYENMALGIADGSCIRYADFADLIGVCDSQSKSPSEECAASVLFSNAELEELIRRATDLKSCPTIVDSSSYKVKVVEEVGTTSMEYSDVADQSNASVPGATQKSHRKRSSNKHSSSSTPTVTTVTDVVVASSMSATEVDEESSLLEAALSSSAVDANIDRNTFDDAEVDGDKHQLLDDQISDWNPIEEDTAPLNLAGPQDLSTRLKKQLHKCRSCGKKFKSQNSLTNHSCKHEEGADENLSTDGQREPLNLISKPLDLTVGRGDMYDGEFHFPGCETFSCVCGKSFIDYEAYVTHTSSCVKTKLTPYRSCDICGKYFFSNSGYAKHKRLHVGAYKFRCNVCHKGFFDRTHMRAHVDSSHSKVRRHECPHCGKSFFWKHHLKRHLGTCGKAKAEADSCSSELCEAPASPTEQQSPTSDVVFKVPSEG